MKLARLGERGQEIPALIDGDTVYDLRSVVTDLTSAALAPQALASIADAHDAGTLPVLPDAASLRIGAPIATPGTVICVGMNYAAHAAESGSEPPALPIVFLKPSNTVVGPNDAVSIPRGSTKTDWEVELAVVIGSRALYLDAPDEAPAHIAGFATANDLSEREFQLKLSGGQWSKGKSAPGFTPLGPWLVTPDDLDAQNLRLNSWVGGDVRQDSSTSDMVFPINYLIWHLSQFMALEAGDVILTGTPEGVALSGRFPYLAEGDIVEVEIEGLGHQRQQMIGWDRR